MAVFNVKKRKILPDAPLLYGNEVVISNDDSVIRDKDEKIRDKRWGRKTRTSKNPNIKL